MRRLSRALKLKPPQARRTLRMLLDFGVDVDDGDSVWPVSSALVVDDTISWALESKELDISQSQLLPMEPQQVAAESRLTRLKATQRELFGISQTNYVDGTLAFSDPAVYICTDAVLRCLDAWVASVGQSRLRAQEETFAGAAGGETPLPVPPGSLKQVHGIVFVSSQRRHLCSCREAGSRVVLQPRRSSPGASTERDAVNGTIVDAICHAGPRTIKVAEVGRPPKGMLVMAFRLEVDPVMPGGVYWADLCL
ncbi:hypothetical protein PI124_g18117 [Phytophthora idaei]|nr:hypothetical protein PI125_g25448 [Phytophthora idaei]KAG3123933.1 hypothetical protein PI126_g23478 [Phytophthora idaei]KAG3236884.1 hypothetical protein PI124_g18117 [Phytophthora idaei]